MMAPSYSPKFYAAHMEGSRRSARQVVPLLMELLEPESVVDIGCGVGIWLAEFSSQGVEVCGADGGYCQDAGLVIDRLNFHAVDLSACSQTGKVPGIERKFSLCLSLEVAEHLSESCADGFVNLLTNLSDVVLFSAAIPDQGGTNHINEQWPPYWIEKFRNRGFIPTDIIRILTWDNRDIESWYRQNMVLFFNEKIFHKYQAKLQRCDVSLSDQCYSRVHPDFYLACNEYYRSIDCLKEYNHTILIYALYRKLYEFLFKKGKNIVKRVLPRKFIVKRKFKNNV